MKVQGHREGSGTGERSGHRGGERAWEGRGHRGGEREGTGKGSGHRAGERAQGRGHTEGHLHCPWEQGPSQNSELPKPREMASCPV